MAGDDVQSAVRPTPTGVAISIKAVPGASRDRVAGMLGDRLKLSVAAPPEGGKANKAICALIAGIVGTSKRDVSVAAGPTSPLKTVEVVGAEANTVSQKLIAAMKTK